MNTNLLKSARAKKGLSQRYMSEKIKSTLSTYWKKETGETPFNQKEMKLIMMELDLTPDEVVEIFLD